MHADFVFELLPRRSGSTYRNSRHLQQWYYTFWPSLNTMFVGALCTRLPFPFQCWSASSRLWYSRIFERNWIWNPILSRISRAQQKSMKCTNKCFCRKINRAWKSTRKYTISSSPFQTFLTDKEEKRIKMCHLWFLWCAKQIFPIFANWYVQP